MRTGRTQQITNTTADGRGRAGHGAAPPHRPGVLRRALLLGYLSLWIGTASACYGPTAADAKAALPKNLYCPPDRVVAKERADLRFAHFGCLAQARYRAESGEPTAKELFGISRSTAEKLKCGKPEEAILSNPARLQMWLDRRERELNEFEERTDAIYEVTGCGEHHYYACEGHVTNGCLRAPATCADLGDTDPRTAPAPSQEAR